MQTRRVFLEKLSVAAAGALVASSSLDMVAAVPSAPHISFPIAPRDRIAVASYPFRAYIESPTNRDRDPKLPGMDLTEFAGKVASKFNVHNIEPHNRHFRSLDSEYLAGFREALQKTSSRVVNIAVDGADSFYDGEASVRRKAIAHAQKWVNVAVQIGSPSIRIHVQRAANSQPNVERTAESLREVTEYAANRDVVVNLENDDLVSEDAFFLAKVIDAVNHRFLRGLPDFANSMMTGDADFNYRALAAMFQHAYGICHVKDGETADQGKYFGIDMKRSFDILKSSGYRGYCSMEYDAPGEPYGPTAKLIDETIQNLS